MQQPKHFPAEQKTCILNYVAFTGSDGCVSMVAPAALVDGQGAAKTSRPYEHINGPAVFAR